MAGKRLAFTGLVVASLFMGDNRKQPVNIAAKPKKAIARTVQQYKEEKHPVPLIEGHDYKDILQNPDLIANNDTLMEKAFLLAAKLDPALILQHQHLLKHKLYANDVWRAMAAHADGALRIVQQFNADEETNKSPEVRFAVLKHFDAASDFDLITHGIQEIFMANYKGILNDMLSKLHKKHQNLTDILSEEQMQRMETFLEAACDNDRIQDVLKYIPNEELPKIVDGMAKQISSDDLTYAVTISDIMLSLHDNTKMRGVLENAIKDHYENESSQDKKDVFGFIAAIYAKNSHEISHELKPFFKDTIGNNPRYTITPLAGMTREQLVDRNGDCNQLMVFADDLDSRKSHKHWVDTYKTKKMREAGWYTEVDSLYTHIYNTSGKIAVHIRANNPGHYEDGVDAIKKIIASKNGEIKIFIGRGHSYYAGDARSFANKSVNFYWDGSCGGEKNIVKDIKHINPLAQFVGTTGIGMKVVNDLGLSYMNKEIVEKGEFKWNMIMRKIKSVDSHGKKHYVTPDMNSDQDLIYAVNKLKLQPKPLGATNYNVKHQNLHTR